MGSTSPPKSSPQIARDTVWSYRISEIEYEVRAERLLQTYGPKESWTDGFTLSAQLRAWPFLNGYEKKLVEALFLAIEGTQAGVAYTCADELYKSSNLRNERKGLLCLTIARNAYSDTSLASVIRHATPFSSIEDDDWAFYAALAYIKFVNFQFQQTRFFLNLAKLIPHHHPAIILKLESQLLKDEANDFMDSFKNFPKIRSSPETVWQHFKEAETMKADFPALIEGLHAPRDLQLLSEENHQFLRFYFRAGKRYYLNDWQFLAQPVPQAQSTLSFLSEAVIKRMACVVDWKVYLTLASTCKQYHNRLNSSAVWLYVLENKWDLDVTCFYEGIPRNPVEIVQQIRMLCSLNETWWCLPSQKDGFKFPKHQIQRAAERNLRSDPVRGFCFSELFVVWRLFGSVIAAARSGILTQRLVENGILSYLTNSLRTDPEVRADGLGLAPLALLYLRNRHTCALVSNFLPPTTAKAFIRSQSSAGDYSEEAAAGAIAAITASEFLYPGAQSTAVPRWSDQKRSFEVSNLDEISRPRSGDFQTALIYPANLSLHVPSHMANDFWDRALDEDLEVEKRRINLDLRDPCLSTPLNEDDEDVLHTMIGIMNERTQDHNAQRMIEKADSKEEPPPPFLDPQFQSYLESNDKVVDRFAAAEEEWHMFITMNGISCENLLHRAILRMTIRRAEPNTERQEVSGHGYWTIEASETDTTIVESAAASEGIYGVNPPKKRLSKASWKKRHCFHLAEAAVLQNGNFEAKLVYGDNAWLLQGSSLAVGFFGSIVSLDGHLIGGFTLLKPESVDASVVGKDDLNAFERLAYTPLKVGLLDLPENAAYPLNPVDGWEDECFAPIQETSDIASTLMVNNCFMHVVHHNGAEFDYFRDAFGERVFGYVSELIRGQFVHDLEFEPSMDTSWCQKRYKAATDYYFFLLNRRSDMCLAMAEEVEADFQSLSHFFSVSEDPCALFSGRSFEHLERSLSTADEILWRNALLIHFKWVARLCIWESAGLDLVSSMHFTLFLLAQDLHDYDAPI